MTAYEDFSIKCVVGHVHKPCLGDVGKCLGFSLRRIELESNRD